VNLTRDWLRGYTYSRAMPVSVGAEKAVAKSKTETMDGALIGSFLSITERKVLRVRYGDMVFTALQREFARIYIPLGWG
jgi:hypothetical protein